ncbi:hypothetical protein NGA_0195400, partial [Nannochloropsis gaditana CCMP526]
MVLFGGRGGGAGRGAVSGPAPSSTLSDRFDRLHVKSTAAFTGGGRDVRRTQVQMTQQQKRNAAQAAFRGQTVQVVLPKQQLQRGGIRVGGR